MSYRVKSILPVAGMFLLTSVLIGMVVFGAGHKITEQLPSSLENLERSKLVEVKDENGNVILSGSFTVSTEADGDIEGVATLTAVGVDTTPRGSAELEVSKKQDGTVTKEFEIEVRKLKPATTFKVLVDGQLVSTIRTNARGTAEVELSNRPTN
jgi:hypothetical protein